MSATYSDILYAYNNARRQLQLIKNQAGRIGELARDPTVLRNMNHHQLSDIKRQLQDYNMHTAKWKN